MIYVNRKMVLKIQYCYGNIYHELHITKRENYYTISRKVKLYSVIRFIMLYIIPFFTTFTIVVGGSFLSIKSGNLGRK